MIVFVQVLPYFTAASFRFPERMGGIPFLTREAHAQLELS